MMMYFLSDLVYGSNLCPPDGTLESNYSAKCPCPPPPERRIVNAIGNRLKTNVIYVVEISAYQERRIYDCPSYVIKTGLLSLPLPWMRLLVSLLPSLSNATWVLVPSDPFLLSGWIVVLILPFPPCDTPPLPILLDYS